MPPPPSMSPHSSWPSYDVLYVVERKFFAKYKYDYITLCLKPFSNLPQLPLQSPRGSSWSAPTKVTTALAPRPQEAPTPAGLPGDPGCSCTPRRPHTSRATRRPHTSCTPRRPPLAAHCVLSVLQMCHLLPFPATTARPLNTFSLHIEGIPHPLTS